MGFGLIGKQVRLVPYDPDRHFENLYQWINDPDVTNTLGTLGTPLTRAQQVETMERITKEGSYFCVETLDGLHVGVSSIFGTDLRSGTATTGSFIGSPEHRGKGYGTESSIIRARYAFMQLGLRILKSEYLGGNLASQRMQEKTGYIEYGVLPEGCWKNGEFRDIVYTYLTRERFFELHGL